MKTIIVVFFLLFVSSILAAPADWEGVYAWSGNGIDEAYNCYEDGWIFGTGGNIVAWAAKVNADGDKAHGKWWSVGYKQGGPRVGQSKNLPTTGNVRVTLNEPGSIDVEVSFRGMNDIYYPLFVGAREETNVTERIRYCGIMNITSNDTLNGEWTEQDSDNSSNEEDKICITKRDYESSYKYDNEDGDRTKGYSVGKCSWGGKVCRNDFSEFPIWGIQLDRLLIDGTKLTLYWYGPFDNTANSTGVSFLADLTGTADDDDCSDHSDELVWPFKCHTFESKKDCEANPYYCKVFRSNDDKCIRSKWP
jgi:hypothetical protein